MKKNNDCQQDRLRLASQGNEEQVLNTYLSGCSWSLQSMARGIESASVGGLSVCITEAKGEN